MQSPIPALVLIDVQCAFEGAAMGPRNNPQAERKIASLLTAWRERSAACIHVMHNSLEPHSLLRPGEPGNAIMELAKPIADEPVFEKTVNSAFIGTDLDVYLRDRGIQSLLIAGFTTDHCVSTSVRMAANLGFEVTVASDATATHERTDTEGTTWSAEQVHAVSLASLQHEFCQLMTTAEAIQQVCA